MQLSHNQILQILSRRVAEQHNGAVFLAHESARWPSGVAEILEKARLIRRGQPADGLICTGCSERCHRQANVVEQAGEHFAISTCELYPNRGPFRHPISRLVRWTVTRRMVAQFVATQIGRTLPVPEGDDRRFCFGILNFAGVRRAVALDFNRTAQLQIGGQRVCLPDIIQLSEKSLHFDRRSIHLIAVEAPDTKSGGKRVLPSSSVQQDKKLLTQVRNRKIQRAAEALWRDDPNLKKKQVADRLAKTNDFHHVSFETIKRLIRKPKKN